MSKTPLWRKVIAAVIYPIIIVLCSTCGLIHPARYAYVGTLFPLLAAFVYFYLAAEHQKFGAATILNVIVMILAFVGGEGNAPLYIGLVLLTAAAEIIRKIFGYDTLKGVRLSFIPMAFSFYAYAIHWWTNTEESLAEAVEEMPAGYADKMASVIDNIPGLVIAMVLAIPVAILGIRLAGKVFKKQAESLS